MSGPAPIVWKDDIQTLNVELEFLTPVFGGGYASGEEKAPHHKLHDEYTPVRSSAFRGALRFWWRATSGAWCESIQKMHEREAEIFGSTEKAGQVSLWVNNSGLRHQPRSIMKVNDKGRAIALNNQHGLFYGCFPMQPDSKCQVKTPGDLHRYTGNFNISLRYPQKYLNEIHLALSALVHFGGLGGRTTRGFGQIAEVTENTVLLSSSAVLDKIRSQEKPPLGGTVPAISALPAHYFHIPNRPNADTETALNDALGTLLRFRQGTGVGRRKGQTSKRPGRSYWPEPEAIRKHTRQRDKIHQPLPEQINAFPRADFGLPIIFHFQSKTDPKDTSLQPLRNSKVLERMRSPLQISVHRDGYSFLVLTAPRAQELTLKDAPKDPTVHACLNDSERQALAAQGGASRELFAPSKTGDTYDVLDAFLQFVRKPN